MGDVKYMGRPDSYLIYQTITITTHQIAQHSSHLFIIEKELLSSARSQVQRGDLGQGRNTLQSWLYCFITPSVCLDRIQSILYTATDCYLDTKVPPPTPTPHLQLTWFLIFLSSALYVINQLSDGPISHFVSSN